MNSTTTARDLVYLKEIYLDEAFLPRSVAAKAISRIKGTGTEVKRNIQHNLDKYRDWVNDEHQKSAVSNSLGKFDDNPTQKNYDDYKNNILKRRISQSKSKQKRDLDRMSTEIARARFAQRMDDSDGGTKIKR